MTSLQLWSDVMTFAAARPTARESRVMDDDAAVSLSLDTCYNVVDALGARRILFVVPFHHCYRQNRNRYVSGNECFPTQNVSLSSRLSVIVTRSLNSTDSRRLLIPHYHERHLKRTNLCEVMDDDDDGRLLVPAAVVSTSLLLDSLIGGGA